MSATVRFRSVPDRGCVSRKTSGGRDDGRWLKLIESRRSLRAPYDPGRPVEPEKLAQILEAARWSPTAHNMQNFEIVVVDDPQVLEAIACLERTVSETFIRENYAQLSFSEEELLQRKTGILGHHVPDVLAQAKTSGSTSFSADEIAAHAQAVAGEPPAAGRGLRPEPARAASDGDFLGIVSLGCVMENMWLAAESMASACTSSAR